MKLIIFSDTYFNLIAFVVLALVITWTSTQGFKVLLKLYLGQSFEARMLVADGDFPSTHTSIVVSSLCLVLFLTFFGRKLDIDTWRAYSDAKNILIMGTLAGIAIRDAVGQRHRQDNTNNNLKRLKDLIAHYHTDDTIIPLEAVEEKEIIVSTISETFASIDNEALKRVGHLKHEVVGGILSGFLGAAYTICIFFGYLYYLPILVIISLVYFFGMASFLKIKPIFIRLYDNFK